MSLDEDAERILRRHLGTAYDQHVEALRSKRTPALYALAAQLFERSQASECQREAHVWLCIALMAQRVADRRL
jgi:hypothetical protein